MISFIVPSHNYGTYLKKCIQSILKNNPKLIKEIIIINDSSRDNTKSVYSKNFKKNKKIKYFETKFNSLSKSVNFGIKKAKGKWISKIDADDWISHDFSDKYMSFLQNKTYDYAYCDLILVNFSKNLKQIKKQKLNSIFSVFRYPVGSGTIFKKKLWNLVGGFNEQIYYQDDYDFWLKIKNLKYIKIGYLEKELYFYRFHNTNMSKNFFKKNYTKISLLIKNIFKS
tara:strand:+ start:2157 stop:2834 length:678 start_codon:yes stop_codon:yes gene_type:complete